MGHTKEMKIIGRNGAYELSVLVDEEDYQTLRLSDYSWRRVTGRRTTYVATNKNGKTIYMHRFIMGLVDSPRSVCIDHIDGNGLNNSRTNLRVTDNRGNQRNARKHLSAGCSSTYKGVCYVPYKNADGKRTHRPITRRWLATITLSDGKQKQLGCYRTEVEAARAYNEAAIEFFGPYAKLNNIGPFPVGQELFGPYAKLNELPDDDLS